MKKIKLLSSFTIASAAISVLVPLASCTSNVPTIGDIVVTKVPDKTTYTQNESLNLDGLIVSKIMSDGSVKRIFKDEYTTSMVDGQKLSEVGTISVKVKLNSENKWTSFKITVQEKSAADFVLIKTSSGYCIDGLNNPERDAITEIVVPETIDGVPVVEISKGAFKGCINLESITLPFIGHTKEAKASGGLFGYVFGDEMYEGCGAYTWQEYSTSDLYDETSTEYAQFAIPSSLTNVTITNAQYIQPGAFSNCKYLKNITIKNNTTNESIDEIGNYAFYGCRSLKSFDFPSTLKVVGRKSFEGCYNLKDITIPSGVQQIKHNAFSNCISAIKAVIPESVEKMGKLVFQNFVSGLIMVEAESAGSSWDKDWITSDTSVVYGYSEGGGIYYTDEAQVAICGKDENKYAFIISWLGSKSGTITIPGTVSCNGIDYKVKKIGPNVFNGEEEITRVIFSENIETIGANCFENCTKLESVLFPSTLKVIGSSCFLGANNLHNHINPENLEEDLEGLSFNKVEQIGNNAFEGNTSIKSIDLGTQMSIIGDSAFKNCTYLTPARDGSGTKHELVFPNTITSIGSYAFYSIAKFRDSGTKADCDIIFEENNTNDVTIGEYAFADSSVKSTSTEYPNQIYFHINFNNIKIKKFEDYVFNNVFLYSIFNFPQDVEEIGNYAFNSSSPCFLNEDTSSANRRKFIVPKSVKSIGNYAFQNWYNCNIEFEGADDDTSSLKSIGSCAFRYCSYTDSTDYTKGFYKLVLPNSVETIGSSAFTGCSYLRTIKLPINDNFTRLESSVFSSCINLGVDQTSISDAVVVPETVTYIGSYVFSGCIKLQYVIINGPITTLGGGCFSGCESIANGKDLGGGSRLQSLIFSDEFAHCTSIGSSVYQGCKNLVWAPFPKDIIKENITSIPSYEFADCNSLSNFEVLGNVSTIGEAAFRNCSSMTEVTGMTAVKNIGKNAFYGNSNLVTVDLPTACHTIQENAFAYCTKLGTTGQQQFIIPSAIIQEFTTESSKGMGKTPFIGWTSNQTIYVYASSIESTEQSTGIKTTRWGWKLKPVSGTSYYTCSDSGSSDVKFMIKN